MSDILARAAAGFTGWLRRIPTPGGARWPFALLAYLGAALVATWPLARNLGGTTYGGPGDGWALIWQTWERNRSGLQYFSVDTYSDLAWPFGAETSTAAFLSNIATELPNVMLLRLGFGDVPAYNLVMLAGLVLSSIAMYGVVRRLGCSAGVAFWAGLVYMVAPWHLEKASIHITLSLMVWLPLALLGVVEFSRRPGLRSGALLVAACALGAYTHVYYGLMAMLVLMVAAPIVLVAASARRDLRGTAARMAAVVGALLLAALPLGLALRSQSEEVGMLLDRPLYLDQLAGAAHRYLLPSVDNPFFGDTSARYLSERGLEATRGELALYLGWVTLALVIVAVVGAIRHRVPLLPVVTAGSVMLLGLVLAMPAHLDLPVVGAVEAPVVHAQRVVDFISTPSRFFAMTLTGAVILAALGLEYLRSAMPGRTWALALVAFACAASAAELVVRPPDRLVSTDPPELVRAIEARVPAGAPVAQYPSTDRSLRPVADQLFWQVTHRRPLMNGASVGTVNDAVRRELSDLGDPALPSRLALLGIGWASFEPGMYPFAPFQELPPAGFEDVGWNAEMSTAEGAVLLKVDSPPASAFAARAYGFWWEGDLDAMWLRGAGGLRGQLLVCAAIPGPHVLSFDANAFGGQRMLRVGDATVDVPSASAATPQRVSLPLLRGWQWVDVEVVGSKPTRPSDVVPGSLDTRPLSLWIGRVEVEGGAPGAPGACSGPLPSRPTRI